MNINDAGKLIGEIPSGYATVGRRIEDMPGLPPSPGQALLHIILSHHACLEHARTILPGTREALVAHKMDKLSGDLGSVVRLERETAAGKRWSRHDRALAAPPSFANPHPEKVAAANGALSTEDGAAPACQARQTCAVADVRAPRGLVAGATCLPC